YSPDGQYIYFNSERTGHMQIWRMKPDGSQQEQVFSDDYNNWFPHISPDGKWMVFLTYDNDVAGHPENKDVMLRLMSIEDTKVTVLAKLFGGQGTINVPSWSSDEAVAFCIIEPLHSTFHRSTYAPWKSVLTRALFQICCHCASGVKDCQAGEDCTT